MLVLFVVPTLNYSAPSVLSKGWGGYISLRFAWIPTSRASIRIGRSPRRGRNNLERQPHDGEPVADGNVLPRNTRTTMASWMEEPAAPHACRSVSLLFFPFCLPYFGWAFKGQIGIEPLQIRPKKMKACLRAQVADCSPLNSKSNRSAPKGKPMPLKILKWHLGK